MRKIVLTAAFVIGLLMIPLFVYCEVYKWVDEKGTVHFTEDNSTIPEKYGQQVERMYLPEAAKTTTEEKKAESKTAGIPLSGPGDLEMPLLFSGLISNVVDSERSIAVTGREKEMTFTVPDDTSIKTDLGENVSFVELKNGGSVTIEYVKKGNDNQARSIRLSSSRTGTTNDALENKMILPGF
jgi:Domain of unknown function (DUF4124)